MTEWMTYKAVASELEALLARAGQLQAEDRQKQLLQALSRLELACLDLPDVEPDDQDGNSPNTYDSRRALVASAFPEFGLYRTIRSASVDEVEEVGVGDAIDDLADILRDIDGALWTEASQSETNAIWEAKFSYEHHSGEHLVDLRSYLYRLRIFGPQAHP